MAPSDAAKFRIAIPTSSAIAQSRELAIPSVARYLWTMVSIAMQRGEARQLARQRR